MREPRRGGRWLAAQSSTGNCEAVGGASGAAALVGVALCCPSAPAPLSAEAYSLRGLRDLCFLFFSLSHWAAVDGAGV